MLLALHDGRFGHGLARGRYTEVEPWNIGQLLAGRYLLVALHVSLLGEWREAGGLLELKVLAVIR